MKKKNAAPDIGALAATYSLDPEAALVRKGFPAETLDIKEGERAVIAKITTGRVDRDHESMNPMGAILKEYRKNPVVMFGHDYSRLPIGRSAWMKKDSDGIISKTIFAEAERSPFADEVYRMYQGGFLRAFSVGFVPISSHQPTESDVKTEPRFAECRLIIDKWLFLEYSAVPIPSNADALAIAVGKGLALSEEMKAALELGGGLIINSDSQPAFNPEAEAEDGTKAQYNCECIKCGHKVTTDKHCNTFKCPKCGGTMRRAERPGPGQESFVRPTLAREFPSPWLKPYPNEHACRLAAPSAFRQPWARVTRKHNGKTYSVIRGTRKSSGKMEDQAFRYPKATWTASEARAHCKSHDGIRFEAAKKTSLISAVELTRIVGEELRARLDNFNPMKDTVEEAILKAKGRM